MSLWETCLLMLVAGIVTGYITASISRFLNEK